MIVTRCDAMRCGAVPFRALVRVITSGIGIGIASHWLALALAVQSKVANPILVHEEACHALHRITISKVVSINTCIMYISQ